MYIITIIHLNDSLFKNCIQVNIRIFSVTVYYNMSTKQTKCIFRVVVILEYLDVERCGCSESWSHQLY